MTETTENILAQLQFRNIKVRSYTTIKDGLRLRIGGREYLDIHETGPNRYSVEHFAIARGSYDRKTLTTVRDLPPYRIGTICEDMARAGLRGALGLLD